MALSRKNAVESSIQNSGEGSQPRNGECSQKNVLQVCVSAVCLVFLLDSEFYILDSSFSTACFRLKIVRNPFDPFEKSHRTLRKRPHLSPDVESCPGQLLGPDDSSIS